MKKATFVKINRLELCVHWSCAACIVGTARVYVLVYSILNVTKIASLLFIKKNGP